MTDEQQLRYAADQRAKQFCIDHNGALIALEEYAAEKTNFDAEMLALANALEKQGVEIVAIAADKKVDKKTMGDAIIKYALRGSVKAHQLGNLSLELGLSHPVTYITETDDQTAITRSTAMKKLMKDNIGILTNLINANILEMEGAITEFTNEKNKPKQAIEVKKATGTDLIGPLLDEIDVPRDNIGKLVHSYLPTLADEWDRVTKVGSGTGVRHLRMIVIYTDFATGVHLVHVHGSLAGAEPPPIIKYSTKTGNLRVKDVANGNYILTSTFPGYTPDVQSNIGLEADKLVRLEIKLHKIV